MSAFQLHPSRWLAILGAFVLFFIVISGNVRYTTGDARYALLESQAILEHGSYRLDDYVAEMPLSRPDVGPSWVLYRDAKTGHSYYDYPVGTSIFALPFVALARAFGMVPAYAPDDEQLQIFIAGTILVIIFLLLFRMALLYLDDWAALVFSMLMVFGTSLISALGTALWSSDFQTLFVMLTILELVEFSKGKRQRVRGAWIGFLLFAGYLCRPTTMALIPVVLGYLWWKDRKSLLPTIGVMAGLFGLFVLWSWSELHRWVPRYYDPGNWEPYGDYRHNLWPILLGPARGLFSFTPVLFIGLLGWAFRRQRREPLFILMWVWVALQTWMVLRSKIPWGGWCYGPRFYAETLPGLALTLLMTLESLEAVRLRWKQIMGTAFIVFPAFGIYVHTYQGLFSVSTTNWNDHPNVDVAWVNVRWDWRFPQFLATPAKLDMRKRENDMAAEVVALLDQIPTGGALLYGQRDVVHREIFAFWNAHDRLHTGKPVFNSVHAMAQAGIKEFWYNTALDGELRYDSRVQLDPLPIDSIWVDDSTRVLAPPPPLGHGRIKSDSK